MSAVDRCFYLPALPFLAPLPQPNLARKSKCVKKSVWGESFVRDTDVFDIRLRNEAVADNVARIPQDRENVLEDMLSGRIRKKRMFVVVAP